MDDKDDDKEIMDKIHIYSTDDEKLKFLGQMLHSDTSRKILQLLIQNEMTANEISDSSGLSLSLVIHHVNKMMQSGIVTISKTTINSRKQPMKYYTSKSGIVILPKKASAKAKQSKSFSNSLKNIMKFASIGVAGVVSWLITKPSELETPGGWQSGEELPESSFDELPVLSFDDYHLSIIISLSVVGIGLLVQFLLNRYKRKRIMP
ncbi:winged helix-turn-helix domain-containing protein [Nitrosopumilus ureiphilus]|uniref:ArsR family transcriptional regulator n=1 Tax=Nitrosopumilus ureiphilus TaxID=1470067 RepID=A0A7D5REH1_9ARCH|nr:winged helix-turn-helix domain-containing protein [Nitrosopumilus ureiphilus]QLH07063.1 ArsR family transcriptional regulator [Nitrosopumilus ureiphilus]